MARILITGTTSGLGYEFMRQCVALGHEVIAVNRRSDLEIESQFKSVQFTTLDIANSDQVHSFLKGLSKQPDMFILNAGVNKVDMMEHLDLQVFKNVWDINYYGVVNFVASAQKLGYKNKIFVGMSSTSNIVPNPAHVSYYLSKFGVKETFAFLQKQDRHNTYKSVVLGPVKTRIMRDYAEPGGIKGKIMRFLIVDAATAAKACLNFAFNSKCLVFNYTKLSYLFYITVRLALKLVPGIYSGTDKEQLTQTESTR